MEMVVVASCWYDLLVMLLCVGYVGNVGLCRGVVSVISVTWLYLLCVMVCCVVLCYVVLCCVVSVVLCCVVLYLLCCVVLYHVCQCDAGSRQCGFVVWASGTRSHSRTGETHRGLVPRHFLWVKVRGNGRQRREGEGEGEGEG